MIKFNMKSYVFFVVVLMVYTNSILVKQKQRNNFVTVTSLPTVIISPHYSTLQYVLYNMYSIEIQMIKVIYCLRQICI